MENTEEIMQSLEEFSKLKPKDIPRELEDYLGYVAKTGDPVFKWSIIKCLFREKMLSVITDFYESTLSMELPPCPNVDPFNYERMKANLLEKLDSFPGAPFTVQRISELLTNPRKEYNRADKFMRAIEKNILVVSTREPGRYVESESDNQETSFNGIAESNDSNIESFPCNDLADPDSSSQTYQITNSEQQKTYSTTVSTSYVESQPFKDEPVNPEEMEVVNATKNVENEVTISTDKESNETVICSTVSLEANDVILQSKDENQSIDENSSESNDSINENSIENVEISENEIVSSDEVKEVSSIEVVEPDDCNNIDDIKKPDSNIDIEEDTVIPSSSNDEECTNSISSEVDDEQPVECDTSNSFDNDESNLFVTSDVLNENSIVNTTEVDTTVNEASTSDIILEEPINSSDIKETEPIEESKIESDDLTSTENMEVGECQISLVDQSDS